MASIHFFKLFSDFNHNVKPFVVDLPMATPPTQVSSTRPRAGDTSPLITPDSLQLWRSSRRLQNTSGTWSRRSVIVNHPMGNVIDPTLATKLLPGFSVCLPFWVFVCFLFSPFPQPLVSLADLVPVPGPTAPRLPAAVYPNASTSTAPPNFHRPRSSSRHFIHSGDSSPQLIPSGSHSSTSSSRDSRNLTERLCHIYSHPRIIKCLRAYRTLRVCLVIFGSVLRSIEILISNLTKL